MRILIATIFISWLTLGMIDMERSKKIPNRKKIIAYIISLIVLWLLQIYEIFK